MSEKPKHKNAGKLVSTRSQDAIYEIQDSGSWKKVSTPKKHYPRLMTTYCDGCGIRLAKRDRHIGLCPNCQREED